MKVLKIITLFLSLSLFSCKKNTPTQYKITEQKKNTVIENLITTEKAIDKYSEIKYTTKVIGQDHNLVIFEFNIIDIPVVLYTYTNDYLAYLEINGKFVPFFEEYFIEYSKSKDKNVFKLLDGIKLFEKDKEYIMMFPIFSNEFTVFQLVGFDENASYKDYGEHTYDGEVFEKIIKTPFEERVFHIKAYQDKPRVYVSAGNNDFLFNDVYYKPQKKYSILSKKQIDNLKQLKTKQRNNNITLNSIVYAQVKTYLNVRSAPNSSGTIIAKAYPTNALKVVEVLEGWLKI